MQFANLSQFDHLSKPSEEKTLLLLWFLSVVVVAPRLERLSLFPTVGQDFCRVGLDLCCKKCSFSHQMTRLAQVGS